VRHIITGRLGHLVVIRGSSGTVSR
jgi:hypothetical protein